MKLKNILLLTAIAACTALNAGAQRKIKTFYVPKAGTFNRMISKAEADTLPNLCLQGKINVTDLRFVRDNMPRLRFLDLSHAEIRFYAGKNGTCEGRFRMYQTNNIPPYAFCKQVNDTTFQGMPALSHVILSEYTKCIEENAFRGCNRLTVCEIRRKEAPQLQPGALTDSLTAVFVPQGSSDSYRQKTEWERFAVIEGKPRFTTIRIIGKSSLSAELMRKALQPADIHFLRIKGKLNEEDFKLIRDYMPNLTMVDLSDCTAEVIPDYTFAQKRFLLKIRLPKGLKVIGQRAFSGCTRLCGTLELPASVTAIEFGAFMDCGNLRHVIVTGSSLTTLGENLFGEQGNDRLLYR